MDIQTIYRPILTYFRRQRLRKFYEFFNITPDTKILDVGGNTFFWDLASSQGFTVPKITIINVYPNHDPLPENIEWVVGDGKKLPFADLAFDLAFSNSVIEHLYDWESQVEFANEIKRVASNYFVQTPSKNFIVEPHFITPFIHWLPKNIQKKLVRNFTVWGLITRPTPEYCQQMLAELRLLNGKEMAKLFPGSKLEIERVLGWEKSIIALKQ